LKIFCWGQFSLWEIKNLAGSRSHKWGRSLIWTMPQFTRKHFIVRAKLAVAWDCVKLTFIHLPLPPIIWVKCSWSSINFRVIWWSLATSLWTL
jgi:hypothetical protein